MSNDLPMLLEGESEDYHDYAFATVRMVGAGFELCAAHVDWLFAGAPPPPCAASADVNGEDREVTIADPMYLLNFLFAGGDPIFPPYPDPGLDPTPDELPECEDA